MHKEFLELLACPLDKNRLELLDCEYESEEIRTATLRCGGCKKSYPVIDFIPRFVETASRSCTDATHHEEGGAEKLKEFMKGFYSANPHYHQLIDETEKGGYTYDFILLELIKNLKKDREAIRLLDVASGTGHYLERAHEFGVPAYGIDISSHACVMTRGKNPHLFISQADAEHLPFKDEAFDIILCLQLLEHTPYPEKVISEISRSLNVGGYLFLSAPNRLGSNLLTRFYRTVKGLFSSQIKDLRSLPGDILEKWRAAASSFEVADLDACNKTNIFQAIALLKENSIRIEYFDTLRHPKKYSPLKGVAAKIRQRTPILRYAGINYKIVARKQ